MAQLHNKIDRKVLKKRVVEKAEDRITLSFYRYEKIGNPSFFRNYLYLNWEPLGVMGRIYVAGEGINAQLSVPVAAKSEFIERMNDVIFLRNIRLNWAIDHSQSFIKLKIKVKAKIVADGLNDSDFDVRDSGQHLNAKEFNALTDQERAILVDMRNHYESEVGHFEGAITPDVDTFRESLPLIVDELSEHKKQPIVMYCTGGIRCEKASAYFKYRGFEEVYQLEGGIIEYTRQVRDQELRNKFKGKNFVFDDRLGERISEDVISVCHQCGAPSDTHVNCANEACHLLFIQCANCSEKLSACCSEECQQFNELPIEQQRLLRKGFKKDKNIFKKGRSEKLLFKK